jgi:hypothetical protein
VLEGFPVAGGAHGEGEEWVHAVNFMCWRLVRLCYQALWPVCNGRKSCSLELNDSQTKL